MITIPQSKIDSFGQGASSVFPEGMWRVSLEQAREKPFPDFIGEGVRSGKNAGYTSGDGEILGLQFGSGYNPETGETTNQKLFIDLVVRDGEYTIEDSSIPDTSWQMDRSRTMLALLAIAVGATEEVELPDGAAAQTIADGFLDELRQGHLGDVWAEVYHENFKRRDGSAGSKAVVRNVMQAV